MRQRTSIARSTAVLLTLSALLAVSASANELGVAGPYNALIFNEFTATSSDVEGRLAAGGDVSINHYSVGDKLDPGTLSDVLITGGDLSFPSGRVYYGNILVAGSGAAVGSPVLNGLEPGAEMIEQASLPIDFEQARSSYQSLSQSLSALTANTTVNLQWGGLYLDGDCVSPTQVFTLDGDELLSAHTFSVTCIPDNATIIFNIDGQNTGLTNMSMASLEAHRNRVIYNFHQATTLTLSGIGVEGTILAPWADIDQPQGVIKGQLIAQSFNGMMQLNHHPFDGLLPGTGNQPPQAQSQSIQLQDLSPLDITLTAVDLDGDPLSYAIESSPLFGELSGDTPDVLYSAPASFSGVDSFVFSATDGELTSEPATVTLSHGLDVCSLYPLTLEASRIAGAGDGQLFEEYAISVGNGNYSLLSWDGQNSANVLAQSLLVPGDSDHYRNPDDDQDHLLDIDDWVQGTPGRNNSNAVRSALDLLVGQDIIVPVWSQTRGSGSNFDYQVASFARIELTDYKLNGQGTFDFVYKGETDCRNFAPFALDSSLTVTQDTATTLVLSDVDEVIDDVIHLRAVHDADDDALSFTITQSPGSGTLAGSGPVFIYTPSPGFVGQDAFSFTLFDGQAASNTATISITVIEDQSNAAPVAQSSVLSLDEDTSISFTLIGSDPDGDSLEFLILQQPGIGVLSGNPPDLVYTPNPDQFGSDALTFITHDGQLDSAVATVTITINPVNDEPVITSLPITSAEVGSTYAYDVNAEDIDSATLDFSLTQAPAGMSIHAQTGQISWLPTESQAGDQPVTVRVSDGMGSSTQAFVVEVIQPNRAPEITSTPITSVDVDVLYSYDVDASDADGDDLSFSLPTAPTGMVIDPITGLITWTPDSTFVGDQSVVVAATDTEGASITQAFTLTVVQPNRTPEITSTPNTTVDVDEVYTYDVEATDADGDDLSFSLTTSPSGMTIDAVTGLITWTPDSTFVGDQSVVVAVTDTEGASITQAFTLTVVQPNRAPEITSTPNTTVDVDGAYTYDVEATDADGDDLSFSLTTAPTGMVIDAITGLITWTPDNTFVGDQSVVVAVTDTDGASITQSFTLTVVQPNRAPEITSTPNTTVDVDEAYTYDVEATDADGDDLSFSLTTAPSGMSIDAVTGLITWTPDSTFVGDQSVVVAATDTEGASITQAFTLTVVQPNRAPEITSTPELTVNLGETFVYAVTASDADSDTLSFSLSGAPAGMLIDPVTGVLTWAPTSGQLGLHSYTVVASDPAGDSDSQSSTLSVLEANGLPIITSIPVTDALEGENYQYDVEASDPDGDDLTFRLIDPLPGMFIDSATGVIDWLAGSSTLGRIPMSVEVSDGRGGLAIQTWEVAVAGTLINRSYLGTDFWMVFMRNNLDGANPDISLTIAAPNGASGQVTSEFGDLLIEFDIEPGDLERIILSNVYSYQSKSGLQDIGLHITTDEPVTVMGFNEAEQSTDSAQAYPTSALGKVYTVPAYNGLASGMATLVATEDNTRVTVIPAEGGGGLKIGNQNRITETFDVTLDAGQTYHMESVGFGSRYFITGTRLISTKPLGVFAGNLCANVPEGVAFCDHVFEQVIPDNDAGVVFMTVPYATRFYGDFFRFTAINDGTVVTVNGELVASLDAGEFADRVLEGPNRIESNLPIHVAQFATGLEWDSDQLPPAADGNQHADPFMVLVPSEQAYLDEYIFTTAGNDRLISHHVNVIIPALAVESIILDGLPVDTSAFVQIPGTDFTGGSLEVSYGTHRISADAPFGLVTYGWGPAESYGSNGNAVLGDSLPVDDLQVTTDTPVLQVGDQVCFDILTLNSNDYAVPFRTVSIRVDGLRFIQSTVITDAYGEAEFCYNGIIPEVITATFISESVLTSLEVEYLPSASGQSAPVILSAPLFELYEADYRYPVQAIDPDGDAISYALAESPPGMSIDPTSGLIEWTPDVPADHAPTYHSVAVVVTDTGGLFSEQRFTLTVNYAPQFVTPFSPEESATTSPNFQISAVGGDPRRNEIRLLEGPSTALFVTNPDFNEWTLQSGLTFTPLEYERLLALDLACRAPIADLPSLQPQSLWTAAPEFHLPVVAPLLDTDLNGVINNADQMFIAGVSRDLVVLDANDGSVRWLVEDGFNPQVAPAIADLDGDGVPEVLAVRTVTDGSQRLVVHDNNGLLVFESSAEVIPGEYADVFSAIEVLDLDQDGVLEISVGPTVLDAGGTLLWQFPVSGAQAFAYTEAFPIHMDLNQDGQIDTLFRNQIRDPAGQLLLSLDSALGASDVMAHGIQFDLDQNGTQDLIVAVDDGQEVSLWSLATDGSIQFGPVGLTDMSMPAIADFTNSGRFEVFLPGDGLLVSETGVVLSLDQSQIGANHFHYPIADLNGDGLYEAIRLNSATSMEIADILSGLVWSDTLVTIEDNIRSGGMMLADITGDGATDMVFGGRRDRAQAIESGFGRWAVRNQSAASYNLSQSGVLGTVQIPTRDRDLLADLWVGKLRTEGEFNDYSLLARIANRGTRALTDPVTVQFWRGNPDLPGAQLLGTLNEAPLVSSESRSIRLDGLTRTQLSGELFVAASTASPECELGNNRVSSLVFEAEVFDSPTRSDRHLWLPGLLEVPDGPNIISTAPTQVAVGSTYAYNPIIDDTSVGDFVLFELLGAVPDGLQFNPYTGQIRWTPQADQLGFYNLTLRAQDLSVRVGTQNLQITALDSVNTAPVITSSAPVAAVIGMLYQYPVIATDVDQDPLTFSLQGEPLGMSIDAISGLIEWTPTADQTGIFPVTVLVDDGQGGQAVQDFMVTSGAMLNSPPVITKLPADQARERVVFQDTVEATDPDGDVLTFALVDPPLGMSINASTGLVRYNRSGFSGVINTIITVTDGTYTTEAAWQLTVAPFEATLEVGIELSTEFAAPGDSVTARVFAIAAEGPYSLTLDHDGLEVPLDANNTGTVTVMNPGIATFTATATDPRNTATASRTLSVGDPNDMTFPEVTILTPFPGDLITAPTEVRADVIEDNLSFWRLVLKSGGMRPTQTEMLRGTTTGSDILLGNLDPTLMLNGAYSLVLEAVDLSGNVSTDSISITIEGNMKVGHYNITLEDVAIDMVGIPLQVTRTYDSRQRNEKLDFGYGWAVDYQNLRLNESRTPGRFWRIDENGGLGDRCARPNGNPVVSVTLPDGDVQRFNVVAIPECKSAIDFIADQFFQIGFEPVGQTTATLEQQSYGFLKVIGGNLVDLGAPDEPVDPKLYVLTTRDQMKYFINDEFGIERIEDEFGNSVTYTDDGIFHSAGKQLDFVRDEQGRISDIILPNGEMLSYSYDVNGDLIAYSDEANRTADYRYYQDHFLKELDDQIGRVVSEKVYDDDGRVIAIIDVNGKRIDMTHDIEGRTEIITNRNGHTTVYQYNERGNVISETNALGETILRDYDAFDNKLSETTPLGHTTTWVYDGSGNALTETNALDEVTTTTYSVRDLVETQFDDAGIQVARNGYFYGTTVHTYAFNDALDNGTSIVTDGRGLPGIVRDAEDNVTRYGYDFYGNRTLEIDPDGNETRWSYDIMGNVLSETRQTLTASGQLQIAVTVHEYDERNRRIRTTHPDGSITETGYDDNGQVINQTDGNGNVTRMTYQASGELQSTRYPDGTTVTNRYDDGKRLIETRDRQNRVTRMVYDEADRLIETILPDDTNGDADNPRTRTEYDADGRTIASIDENGNRTEYEYDALGRQVLVRDALGLETTTEYNNRGLRVSATDANGHTIRYVYDDASRLIETIFPDATDGDLSDNPRMTVDYDGLGRKIRETDELGRVMQYAYDARGNMTHVTDPAGQVTRYVHDSKNRKTQQIDASGRITRWDYDVMDRVIRRTLPLGQVEQMSYDAAGNRQSMTDFNGQRTDYRYDENNRLVLTLFADGSQETRTYTDNGLLATLTDDRGTTTHEYDVRDRLIRITNPDGTIVEYGYDAVGNKTELVTANQAISYGYDALNRLRTVNDVNGQTGYSYDAVGNRETETKANGTRTSYAYDERNRLIRMEQQDAAFNVIQGISYTLNDDGMRAQIAEDAGRVTDYTYDILKRLEVEQVTDATLGNRTSVWTYDATGNRLTQDINGALTTYVYNANDQLTQETTGLDVTTYQYDANGSTVLKRLNGTETARYSYDSRNRMTGSDTNGIQTSYVYDHAGIRREKTEDNVQTTFLVDPTQAYTQVIEELDHQGRVQVSYTFGDDLISQQRFDELGAFESSFYHYDGLGSTRLLTDFSGATLNEYVYEAFGEIEHQSGTTENLYLFTGEQFDPNLGFYYLRARYYNPANGRFHTLDTYMGKNADPVTLHKYLYANADPVGMIDPSGLSTLQSQSAATNAMVGLVLTAVATVSMHSSIDTSLEIEYGGFAIGLLTIMSYSPILGQQLANLVGASAKSESGSTRNLYRAVEDVELASLYELDKFAVGPNRFPKQFFHTAAEAHMFAVKLKSIDTYHIVRATISERMYQSLFHGVPEPGIGPIVTVNNGMLGAFNTDMKMHGGWAYISTHSSG